MALLEIEKKKTVKVEGMSTDEQVAHLGTLGQDNLGTLNLAPTNYEFKQHNDAAGMNEGHLKTEVGIVSICIATFFLLLIIFGSLGVLGYVGIKVSKLNVQIFPTLSSYSMQQYKDSVIKTYLILGGMLFGTCLLTLILLNLVIKSRFISRYLSKMNVYIYSVFASLINCGMYFSILLLYFLEINKISKRIRNLYESGKIAEKANPNLVEPFKYIVVVLIVIFMIANCFRIMSIVKKKNQFIFEEEV